MIFKIVNSRGTSITVVLSLDIGGTRRSIMMHAARSIRGKIASITDKAFSAFFTRAPLFPLCKPHTKTYIAHIQASGVLIDSSALGPVILIVLDTSAIIGLEGNPVVLELLFLSVSILT